MRRWLGSRRVYTKILLVAAVAVAGTAATGILALVGITQLRDTRNGEVGDAVPYVAALNQAALSAKAAANDERGYLLRGDTEFRDEALGRQSTVNAALQTARDNARAAEPAAVEQIRAALDAWFGALKTEFAAYPTDRDKAIADAFGANRDLRKVYEGLLDTEIKRANAALVAGRDFDRTANETRVAVIALLCVALALAVAMSLYIANVIVHPLRRVSSVLRAVAGGDLTQDAGVDQRDEVGQMADSLRQARSQLRTTVADLAEHSTALASASEQLAATSRESAAGAESGSRQAGAVATLADRMSGTISTVASGATEMGASIREISQSATKAVTVAARAVEVAAATTDVMSKLGDSSAEIGNVIKVITSIAGQTNLLALNATIEAARAGEAGKGFAVVANEVKDLAQETARATEDISRRVQAIQSDTTGAVAAMSEISDIIARINEYQTTIASAVEQQSATTEEMNRSVEEAASTGRHVAETIAAVASSVNQTTTGVAESERAAGDLARLSGSLRTIVQTFRY
ncbi:methyl-accepting chemotaxis protein [Dactylosporangium sp. CS-033363]|uniref:methyl-accepting chemotaxis protein n=1 Tax=Dactylosporangium sp. CS-033363 TaxID=3239935 RepID=UPI003D937596